MPFTAGQIILRRYFRADSYTWVQPMRVVADDPAGLLLWHPVGSEYARLMDENGRSLHDVTFEEMRRPELTVTSWSGHDILVFMPPRVAYSVWWFFDGVRFAGWYVNLEEPYRRRDWGVETTDHVLDLVVGPDRGWRWKDEDEFAARTGLADYYDEPGAAAIRAEGERLARLAEEGAFPFDGTHMDFRPDPSWLPPLHLPAGWDVTDRRA